MKKKMKSWISVLLCLCVLAALTACRKRTDVPEGAEFIYCLNENRTGLVKVTFERPDGDVEEQIAAVLEELAKPAEDIEYVPVLREGVQVLESGVTNVIAYVDFNQAYKEQEAVEEKLVRAAVVRSLQQIPGIDGVLITIEGEALKDASGHPVGILNADDFVENTGSSLSAYQTGTLTLYFANETGDMLVEKKMNVRYNSNISVEKTIVEKLMQGPGTSGAYPTLNPEATVLSVTVKDGICYVNFDSEFLNSVYDVKPEIVIYSLVNSLLEGTTAGKVQITVNGIKDAKYMETIDLSKPFQRNLELVESAEEE